MRKQMLIASFPTQAQMHKYQRTWATVKTHARARTHTHTLCHDVSRVLSSVSLHSLVALEAAKGEGQLGVPVLVHVRALRPSAFLPLRRVAA